MLEEALKHSEPSGTLFVVRVHIHRSFGADVRLSKSSKVRSLVVPSSGLRADRTVTASKGLAFHPKAAMMVSKRFRIVATLSQ